MGVRWCGSLRGRTGYKVVVGLNPATAIYNLQLKIVPGMNLFEIITYNFFFYSHTSLLH